MNIKNMQNEQLRAALYARVSSEEQVEGYSIDAQRRAFQTLCQNKGWIPYHEYIEEGKSARTENINKRPVFKEAISEALNKKFDILVVHKVDRFSRKLRITLEYFDKLGKADVGFVSIMEQMDFSSPWGKFALSMLGALAELYSDNLSQETKKGWHERRKQGLYCGTLPFGAMKNEDGIPVKDIQDRKINMNEQEITVRNFEGLKRAFELSAQGKSDREVAITLNGGGYRTTGTHGPRPFSKDTIKDMLSNRFYIGYIQDGNGGWLKAKHDPFIDAELFEEVQKLRTEARLKPNRINVKARIYSLSGIATCNRCGGNIRMQTNPNGKARVYCASRSQGLGCEFSGTFVERYEIQIEWYLTEFTIPEDYQKKILEAHSQLTSAYEDVNARQSRLTDSLQRLKKQYRWQHITEQEYLSDYKIIERQLAELNPIQDKQEEIQRLAHFLVSVADAWKEGTQEQRNRLAKLLFEEIRLDNGGKVIAVKPRTEFEPFFRLSYKCHAKDIGCDPCGDWTLECNTLATPLRPSAMILER